MKRIGNLSVFALTMAVLSACGDTLTRTQEMITKFECTSEDFKIAKAEFMPLFKRQNEAMEGIISQMTTGAKGQLYALIEELNEKMSSQCTAPVLKQCALETRPFTTDGNIRDEWGNWRKQQTLRGPITAFGIEAKTHRHVTPRGFQIHVDVIEISDERKLDSGLECFIQNAPAKVSAKRH